MWTAPSILQFPWKWLRWLESWKDPGMMWHQESPDHGPCTVTEYWPSSTPTIWRSLTISRRDQGCHPLSTAGARLWDGVTGPTWPGQRHSTICWPWGRPVSAPVTLLTSLVSHNHSPTWSVSRAVTLLSMISLATSSMTTPARCGDRQDSTLTTPQVWTTEQENKKQKVVSVWSVTYEMIQTVCKPHGTCQHSIIAIKDP